MPMTRSLRFTALACCLAVSMPVVAEIYKWRDAEGNLHFSDEEPAGGAERIEVKPLPIMNFPTPEPFNAEEAPKEITGYEIITVTKPSHRATLRDIDGTVPVTVRLEPPLQEGHSLQVWVDGEPAGPAQPDTALSAENVSGGEHRLKVVVLDEKGETLQSSAEVRFFVQQDSPDP